MEIKSYNDYEMAVDRIKCANKEDKQMALQILNLMIEQDITSCNAKIVLELCHYMIEINSKFTPIE